MIVTEVLNISGGFVFHTLKYSKGFKNFTHPKGRNLSLFCQIEAMKIDDIDIEPIISRLFKYIK